MGDKKEISKDELSPEIVLLQKEAKDKDERIVKLEKTLKTEQDARVLKEFVEQAKTYDSLSGTADELGGLLKEASEKMSADGCTLFHGELKSHWRASQRHC